MKSKKRLLSLRVVLVILSGLIIILGVSVISIMSAVNLQATLTEAIKSEIQAMAESVGNGLKSEMEVAMDTSRTLAIILGNQSASNNPQTREGVTRQLQKILIDNPAFFGISTGWEPNAFDRKDDEYAGIAPSDATGRFIPYWFRGENGQPELTALLDYETPGIGDYYLLPRQTLEEVVIEPYLYPIDGKDVAMTSLMVPITNGQKFVGVVGVDILMDSFQEKTDQFDLFDGKAKMYIFSSGGTVVGATGQPEVVGKTLSEVFSGRDVSAILKTASSGETKLYSTEEQIEVVVPYYIGKAANPWSVMITVPSAVVFQQATKTVIQTSLIAAGILLAAIVLLWFGTGLITKPLGVIEKAAERISKGDMKWEIAKKDERGVYHAFAEISAMARSLEKTTGDMIEKVVWYEGILDSIPFPLSVTDMDMNWTFINKPTEGLLGITRAQARGSQCKNWKAGICETLDCGIARLRAGFNQTLFDQWGLNFKVDTSYLLDSKGEKIGHVEVVSEITNLVSASNYEKVAVGQLSSYLERLAEGQLGFDIENLPEANEHTLEVRENFENILKNLEKAREMLRAMIGEVLSNSTNVTESSNQLSEASQQAGQATSQIATTIQQITKGITQQSEATSLVTRMVEEEGLAIKSLVKGTEEQGLAVRKASEVTNLITGEDGISAKVMESSKKVEEIGERSNQIGIIVETIEDIASQTNLLALNAAIEAARAGEQGKGFAVVADEVRKLAERSSTATKEIGELIGGIQKTIQEAVVVSTSAAEEINLASADLMDSIQSVAAVVTANEEITSNLAANSGKVMQATENIAAVSEENSAAIEEVSASTEEMSAQVEEVTASAQSLADMANGLRDSVEKFSL